MRYLFEGIPLLATLGVASVLLLGHRAISAPVAARICVWAVSAQIVLAVAAWLLPGLLPRGAGAMCPDVRGFGGDLLLGMAFGTVALGGLVIATATIAARAGIAPARALVVTPVALVVPYAAFLSLVLAAVCGS